MNERILPGGTLGILGGGQLGRMTALAARHLGYRIAVLTEDADSPGAQAADEVIVTASEDTTGVERFAQLSDVATIEFENISVAFLERLEGRIPVRPRSEILAVSQNRISEKERLQAVGVPTAVYSVIRELEDVKAAASVTGFPAIVKTATGGYDGKGQAYCRDISELQTAVDRLGWGKVPLILEAVVPFAKELSVLVARSPWGDVQAYPVIENEHRQGILHRSLAPARVPEAVARRAQRLAVQVAEGLELIGLLAVEMFLTDAGEILVNEIAPRPHNSGHLTLDASHTSQFEQHVRAVCGLPLGSPGLHSAAVMLNLLGEHLPELFRRLDDILKDPCLKLHLYGKKEARRRRKMGHLTLLGADAEEALARAQHAWRTISPGT